MRALDFVVAIAFGLACVSAMEAMNPSTILASSSMENLKARAEGVLLSAIDRIGFDNLAMMPGPQLCASVRLLSNQSAFVNLIIDGKPCFSSPPSEKDVVDFSQVFKFPNRSVELVVWVGNRKP
jgi:hypothetical protein